MRFIEKDGTLKGSNPQAFQIVGPLIVIVAIQSPPPRDILPLHRSVTLTAGCGAIALNFSAAFCSLHGGRYGVLRNPGNGDMIHG
jgi:hypothetical protein